MITWLRRRLRAALHERFDVPGIPRSLDRLKRNGLMPKTIFDVGAYRGDFARDCLLRWPEATIACFEPQQQAGDRLRALAAQAQGRIRVFPVLLGARPRKDVILHEAETASSVLAETAGPRHPTTRHPMTTVDEIVEAHFAGRGPDLLKLDVQGYELEVLKGATVSLTGLQALVTEVNLLDLHADVPLLDEVVAWLAGQGFVAYDISGLMRRPLDGALWQMDLVFVPADSPLRRDKRWGRS